MKEFEDINDSLLAKINQTERNIERKERAELEMMEEVNLGMVRVLRDHIGKIEERSKLSQVVQKLLLDRFSNNPDEYELPTRDIIVALKVILDADSKDTGNIMQLIKSENTGSGLTPQEPVNQLPKQQAPMPKEKVKENKKFLETMEIIKNAIEEIEDAEDS